MDDVSKNTKLVSLSINCDSFTSCQPANFLLFTSLLMFSFIKC